MITKTHLIMVADSYQNATRLNDTTVSYRVFGDSKKLSSMRNGADITVSRFNDALVWFSDHWPDKEPWPDCIDRPITSTNEVA